jgi:hypothetical protein
MSIKKLIAEMVQDTLDESVELDEAKKTIKDLGQKTKATLDSDGAMTISTQDTVMGKQMIVLEPKQVRMIHDMLMKESVELTEDVHNDLSDLLIKFEKDLMKYINPNSGVDAEVRKELAKAGTIVEKVRQGRLFKVRPGR